MMDSGDKVLAETVGRAIAIQRMRCKMTQEEVAEQLGIGNEAVSRIERGIVMPNIARLFELATIFDCDTAALLDAASVRADDQARHLSGLLSGLNESDRQWLVETVEHLSRRFAQR